MLAAVLIGSAAVLLSRVPDMCILAVFIGRLFDGTIANRCFFSNLLAAWF